MESKPFPRILLKCSRLENEHLKCKTISHKFPLMESYKPLAKLFPKASAQVENDSFFPECRFLKDV